MLRERITHTRVGIAAVLAIALLAPVPIVASSAGDEDDRPPARPGALLAHAPPVAAPAAVRRPVEPVAAPLPAPDAPPAAPAVQGQLVTEPDVAPTVTAPVVAAAASAPSPFAERFPAHAAAVQDPTDPATTRWALLIGINEHRGSVADNIGSRQDAEDLRAHLLANGWRDDHILLLTDRDATGANIEDGIAWLAERTDEDSVAVFHYSGHSKKWYARDVDGDGERTDEGLWPSDDDFIVDSELVRLLHPVRPHALWVSFATCNAAGLADPGLARPGRILTFSSGEPQKSYEHPAWGNSVWGWLMIEQAFATGVADVDGDGRVTVEEAFDWARPRARDTTIKQRYGPQDGVIVDQVAGGFDLLIPGTEPAPRPPPSQPPSGQPEAEPAPEEEPPERTEENHGNKICLLCSP